MYAIAIVFLSQIGMSETQTLTAPAGVAGSLPRGPSLETLRQRGEVIEAIALGPPSTLTRPEPFHAEPLDPSVSFFAAEFTDAARRSHANGPLHLVSLADTVVVGRGALLVHQGRILPDGLTSSDGWRPGSILSGDDDTASVRLTQPLAVPQPLPGAHMLGFVGAWRNHAHWISECLPRLVAYRFTLQQQGVRVLLPPLPPGSPQAATVRLLQIPAEAIRELGDDDVVRVGRLWTTTGFGVWHPPPLCRAAALVLSMAVPLSDTEAAGDMPERLYIRRDTDTRRLLNYEALKPVLAKTGFQVAVLQGFPLEQQIRLLRNARLIIGENSGGLANVMFCRRGARLLELNNPAFVQPAHWALAGLANLDYGFAVGRHAAKWDGELPTMNSNYTLDPDRFAAAVAALLAVPRA